MQYYEVAPTKIVRVNATVFTYHAEMSLPPGTIVKIPVGKQTQLGVIIRSVPKPSFTTRAVTELVEQLPIPLPLLETALWMSEYYATHLATVLSSILPRGITKQRRIRKATSEKIGIRANKNLIPTDDQQRAIDTITASASTTHLLHGVTGSGKTLIYKQLAKQQIDIGKSVILLVPEIALTSQLVDEFLQDFPGQVLLTHSQQTEAERHVVWQQVLRDEQAKVIIGPRSALFLPASTVGLIIIDEMHEPSYKQEQSPRYSALRAATILAARHGSKAVFGSATPPVAEYYTAQQAGAPIITLSHRAHAQATKPTVQVVDMTKRQLFTKHRFLSDSLLKQMNQSLLAGKQVLLFHNRRGSAALTLCENCGWTAIDPDTGTPLTLHADTHELIGHISGYRMRVPTMCPACKQTGIIHKGIGTKLIEQEIIKLFPNKKVVRFDGDSGPEHSVDSRYKELYDGTIDIIIGTQVIAKGIDLPMLETVGVVQADAGLALPDYTTHERTFQLIAQVIGRVGRGAHPTHVVVQSYQPTHPAVQYGTAQDYQGFYAAEIAERQRYGFPPYSYLLKLICTYKTETAAVTNARKFATALRGRLQNADRLLGPTPAFYEKLADAYRWQITVRSPHRAHLLSLIDTLPPGNHWQYEIDPMSLLS